MARTSLGILDIAQLRLLKFPVFAAVSFEFGVHFRYPRPSVRNFYYTLKPFVPRRIRIALRRSWARRKRQRSGAIWPIDPAAAQPPTDWPGWPDRKQFAFALSHDVEGPQGLGKCRQVAELEMQLGFRSSFNLIPEGTYEVPSDLRAWLTEKRFEVGVHDLHHDGKLYRGEKKFTEKASRINQYLRAWNAVGFRSGFMLRNLKWIHQLNIQYDSSTFDTDPFEPQCDGSGTIFPYWIPAIAQSTSGGGSAMPITATGPSAVGKRAGYFELPYTLPQDSTLFLILEEKTPEIWLRKLDWVAEHGGMALVNVHPDYVQFDSAKPESHTFPVRFYSDLLRYVETKYAGKYWHATPRQIAEYMSDHRKDLDSTATNATH